MKTKQFLIGLIFFILGALSILQLKYALAESTQTPITSPITGPIVTITSEPTPTSVASSTPAPNTPSPSPTADPGISAGTAAGQGQYIAGKLNIVFIAANYPALNAFFADAGNFKNHLLTFEPFKSRPQDLNFIYIYGDQNLGCMRPDPSVTRLIVCNDLLVSTQLIKAGTLADKVVVIDNDPIYGGSGSETMTVTYNGQWGAQVFVHEFGHALGDLLDEYEVSSSLPETNTVNQNCFEGTPTAEVWAGIPLSQYAKGCTAGNWYRSSETSIMRDVSIEYFKIGRAHV